MSAKGAEEITHNTDALLRPRKQIQVGQQVDQIVGGS